MYDRAMQYPEKKLEKKFRQREVIKSRMVDEFISEALKLRHGREFFYWMLSLCHIGHNPFTTNALTTSFACGELNIGQQLQARIIEVAPQHFLDMLTEQQKEQEDARHAINDRAERDGYADTEPGDRDSAD